MGFIGRQPNDARQQVLDRIRAVRSRILDLSPRDTEGYERAHAELNDLLGQYTALARIGD